MIRIRNWHLLVAVALFIIAAISFGWSTAGMVLGICIGLALGISIGAGSVVFSELTREGK